jgi:hypothetical protein
VKWKYNKRSIVEILELKTTISIINNAQDGLNSKKKKKEKKRKKEMTEASIIEIKLVL